jgi:chromate transporter
VIILVIAAFLQNFMDIEWVSHAFNGIRAGVVALILSSVIKLYKNSVIDWPTRVIYLSVLALAAAGTFLTLPGGVLGVILGYLTSPVVLVVLSGVAGLCIRAARGGLK